MRPSVRYALYTALGVAVIGVLFAYREPLLATVQDPDAIRSWLETLGPFGPAGLIALFVLQMLIAPIPGYFFQVVAGYLFGWAWGAFYASIGLVIGGALAMTLARVYGRPLVRRAVGADRLQRWENVTHLNSLGLWFLLMLGPLGDIVFFFAGLTTLPVWKIIAMAVVVRAPVMTISAAVGAGQLDWRSPWLIGGLILLMSIGLLGVRFQARIERLVARYTASPSQAEATQPVEGA